MRGVKGYSISRPKFAKIETCKDRCMAIIREIAKKHQMRPSEIVGHGRYRYMLKARDEAIYRLRFETKLSTTQIGKLFNRDHSSIVTSLERSGAREKLRTMQLGMLPKNPPKPYTMPIWLNI